MTLGHQDVRMTRGESAYMNTSARTLSQAPVVVITGAGRGIGALTAQRFAQNGWQVALLDRDPDTIARTALALGDACVWYGVADVGDHPALVSAAQAIDAVTGRLDVLVNNAGILRVGPFESIAPDEAAAQIRVNFLGVVNATYAFFDRLKSTPRARVVNVASASSIYGTPDFAVYSATKFAVRGLTEALAIEFRRHDIRVCDISPPFVAGAMLAEQRFVAPGIARTGGTIEPDVVAGWIWRAATEKRRRVHYTLKTDQRLLRPFSAIPALAGTVMARFMAYGAGQRRGD